MSYQDNEGSIEASEPVELYLFSWGVETDLHQERYTSGDTTVTHATFEYTPATIKRSTSELSSDMNKVVMEITTHKNLPLVAEFIPGSPDFPISVTILRQQTTGNVDSDYVLIFKGRVTKCAFSDFEATLTCEPIITSLKRAGLRQVYEVTCTNGIYDNYCQVSRAAFEAEISSCTYDGRKSFTFTRLDLIPPASEEPGAGYFTGGMLKLNNAYHMISNHTVNNNTHVITLVRHLVNVSGGTLHNIKVYPGCDLLLTTCNSKFRNKQNFRGFPWIKAQNPYLSDNVQW